jgi:hypothetical protein
MEQGMNYANATPPFLEWTTPPDTHAPYREAILGDFDGGDGVRFSLIAQPTCYRRGVWKLLVEVAPGPMHHAWGCFDQADQPMRYYHLEFCALREAEALAAVLLADRAKFPAEAP